MKKGKLKKVLLLATGALLACREMPNDGVNQEITDMLIDQISKLSPKSVNSKGIVDFERIKKLGLIVHFEQYPRRLDKNFRGYFNKEVEGVF